MRRFFLYPLLTSILVWVELMLYLSSALLAWNWLFWLFLKSGNVIYPTWKIWQYEFSWTISKLIVPRWLYLVGLGLLLGLGMAGYERISPKSPPRNLWQLVLNAFWFGFYTLLLTTPVACGLQALGIRNSTRQTLLATVFQAFLPWSGLVIVCLAAVYFMNSNGVFSPKTIVRRIRYGRFKASEH